MLTIQRRRLLGRLAGLGTAALGGIAAPLWAQTAKKGKLAAKLRIVIPAPTRTSLDEAGRALGDALVGMSLCDEVEYENKDGKGGLLGLAYFTEKYGSDPNTLFVGDTTLVGALALQKPAGGHTGTYDMAISLSTITDTSCLQAWAPGVAATVTANLAYLQGNWCGITYAKDPSVRASFGTYSGSKNIVYQRENF